MRGIVTLTLMGMLPLFISGCVADCQPKPFTFIKTDPIKSPKIRVKKEDVKTYKMYIDLLKGKINNYEKQIDRYYKVYKKDK